MKTKHNLLILVALTLPPAVLSQQPQQPPPAPTQPQAAPCAPTPTPQPPKGLHFNLPKGLQQAIDKQRQQIQNQTGITVPSTQDLTNQAKQAMSPCGKAPAPAPTPPPQPIPAPTPAPQTPAKTAAPATPPSEIPTSVYGFACPKGTKLHVVPGYAYCKAPNGDVTAAILMMAGFPMPDGYYAQTAAEALANTPTTKQGAEK